jgi:hypothetical protein
MNFNFVCARFVDANEPKGFDAGGQHLYGAGFSNRRNPMWRLNGIQWHRSCSCREMAQLIPLSPNSRAQPAEYVKTWLRIRWASIIHRTETSIGFGHSPKNVTSYSAGASNPNPVGVANRRAKRILAAPSKTNKPNSNRRTQRRV